MPCLATGATADDTYPNNTIKIVVGLPPGGAPDTTARLLAEKLQEAWGKPVIVENVAGAAGNIAADRVAKSPPDGHTLLMAGNASIVVNLNLYEKLPYDPVKDLVPVSQVSMTPNVLAVPPELPAKSVAELVALARSSARRLDLWARRRWHLPASRRRAVQAHGGSCDTAGRLPRARPRSCQT